MLTGKVKWFNATKAYGFITPDDNSKDIFVHVTALNKSGITTLKDGQAVSFEVEEDKGKKSAVNLKII